MVAVPPVDGASHRIDYQAVRHRLRLDHGVQSALWIEWRTSVAVLHQFHPHQQPAPVDIAHMGGTSKSFPQQCMQRFAARLHGWQQLIELNHFLHGQRRRNRMPDIGVPVQEAATALAHALAWR